ncbi:5-formyltetrahydrofolate cyclo-ligase [Rhodococcus sp. NPDC003318]|uniref:5-formyltetrahydrofolate cyclo-ligase n=1 Tax=Rhodococcus sp. NPDC003318 TaxID=3364503 RepID=UPI003690B8CB
MRRPTPAPQPSPDTAGAATKTQWREEILARRREVTAAVRDAETAALTTAVTALGRELGRGATVCAYVPVGGEPGGTAMLDALAASVGRVLLPVAREPGPLRWATYDGVDALVRAPFGLREPAPPFLPPESVAEATMLLVPALAVDRRGVRLGRGAGFYDRTLGLAAGARLVAVVRDDELVARLPEDAHDVRMHEALTPGGGLQVLGQE